MGQGEGLSPARHMIGDFNAPEIFAAGNPLVVGKLVPDEQQDQDRAGQAHSQACDVDEAVQFVARDAA